MAQVPLIPQSSPISPRSNDVRCSGHTRALLVGAGPNGVTLTAGGANTPAPLGSTVLALAQSARKLTVTGLPGYRPVIIRLDWPDMSVPAMTGDDWRWLAGRLAKLPDKRLHVHCQVGHGRTGTALAILGVLWEMAPYAPLGVPKCPVEWVRAHYCPSAVETAAQCAYVADVTGRVVTAAPSHVPASLPTAGGALPESSFEDTPRYDGYSPDRWPVNRGRRV